MVLLLSVILSGALRLSRVRGIAQGKLRGVRGIRGLGASQLLQGRCLFVAAFKLKHHSSDMPVVLMPLQEL